jgi:Putative peptidoglycan binding domain
LPEALARSHHDSILSRPDQAPTKRGKGALRAVLLWALALPARSIAGAALAAVLVGIVVNALALQKERHPAPFFPAKPAVQTQPAAPAQTAIVAAVPDASGVAVEPPVRPANLGVPADAAASVAARAGDPIRDLLRGETGKDASHLIIAAQNALIKLGYTVKADGVAGASTIAAIREFEHSHGLPASSEITPKLVKQLSAAATQ